MASPEIVARAPSGPGGFYGDFGLGFIVGLSLHVDGSGVTASVGTGFFGRAQVGYATDQAALANLRKENKIFVNASLGKRDPVSLGGEISEKLDSASLNVSALKIQVNRGEAPQIGWVFDTQKQFTTNLTGKTAAFGVDLGFGWLHTLSTKAWNPPKFR